MISDQPGKPVLEVTMTTPSHIEQIQAGYGAVAASTLSSRHAGIKAIAEAFGYTSDDLAALPAEVNMGLSCGNPVATANLRSGEVVVDLGCGGGIDVLLAAPRVGPTGKAIGIDMTPEMIERARRNATLPINGVLWNNVEFHLARMEALPLADGSVDCIISNCVINLAADKSAVYHEMVRVLKPGGRLAISDIALKQPLPADLARDVGALIGCIAGALLVSDYERGLREAGFATVQIIDTGKDLNVYGQLEHQTGCCSPAMSSMLPVAEACCGPGEIHANLARLLRQYNINEYAASVQVYGIKEGGGAKK
jgi:SAM-dependent methyltransferase